MNSERSLPAAQAKFRPLVAMICILPTIAVFLSGVITVINTGVSGNFGHRWLRAFFSAIPVMVVALGIIGLLEKTLATRFPRMAYRPRQLVTALITACIMESVVSAAVTLSTNGAGPGFTGIWAQAFIKSLPAGLVVSLIMGLVIKPKFLTPPPSVQ
jgi:hypothetical protein